MERDLDKIEIQSWSYAYVKYKAIKKWIGDQYPVGYWTIIGTEYEPPHAAPESYRYGDDIAMVACNAMIDADQVSDDVQYGVTLISDGHPTGFLQPSAVMLRCRPPGGTWEDTIFLTIQRRDSEGGLLSVALDGERCVTECAAIQFHLQRDIPGMRCPSQTPSSRREEPRLEDGEVGVSPREAQEDAAAPPSSSAVGGGGSSEGPQTAAAADPSPFMNAVGTQAKKDFRVVRMISLGFPKKRLAMYVRRVCDSNYLLAKQILAECDKVNDFYNQQSTTWTRELMRLFDQANRLCLSSSNLTSSPESVNTPADSGGGGRSVWTQQQPLNKSRMTTGERKRQVEQVLHALRRMYFACTLLLQFIEQNSASIQHLVSKTEKRSQQVLLQPFDEYIQAHYHFFVSHRGHHPLNNLLDFIESRYIEYTSGDKKGAARDLHVKNQSIQSESRTLNAAAVGVMFGMSLGCVLLSFVEHDLFDTNANVALTYSNNIGMSMATQIMYLVGLATLLAVLFAVNVVVWDAFRVNYPFIFELDERRHWDGPTMLRYTMKYCTVWSVGLFLFTRVDTVTFLAAYKPLVPFAVLIAVGALGVMDILAVDAATKALLQHSTRMVTRMVKKNNENFSAISAVLFPTVNNDNSAAAAGKQKKQKSASAGKEDFRTQWKRKTWLGNTLFHILVAPFITVSFSDFYIADQLTSLTGFFGQIQSLICAAIGVTFTPPVFAVMPHVWRFFQCLRRWRDAPGWLVPHPNISNSLKYVSGLAQIISSWHFSNELSIATAADPTATPVELFYRVNGAFSLWITCAVIEYCFKCFWDLYMDAGMFQTGWRRSADNPYPLIRKKILYAPQAYWGYAALNLVLRLGTLLRIILIARFSPWAKMNSIVWWVAEVFRRFVWNFFRVENEQVSNMEKYRAVDLIPANWSDGESSVLGEMDAQFAALYTACGSTELPPKSMLFDRLPLHHKHSGLNTLMLEKFDYNAADDVWTLSHAEAREWFHRLHNEDQLRVLCWSIGRETVSMFLRRFPAESKDILHDDERLLKTASFAVPVTRRDRHDVIIGGDVEMMERVGRVEDIPMVSSGEMIGVVAQQ